VPAEELDAEVNELARRLSFVDADLLSANKRIVNLALELQGAQILQRLATENDARAHLAQGPRRAQFKADMASVGMKEALKNRDAPFGDGFAKVRDYSGR
jgi:enoyl-CoA hydratase